jgi:hypothetical protein
LVLAVGSTGELGSTLIEEDGTYTIMLPPDLYEVSAFIPGGIEQVQSGVVVEPGESVKIDFLLSGGASISGLVALADGVTPVDGVYIYASSSDGALYTAKTSALGRYTIEGMPAGEYKLEIVSEFVAFLPISQLSLRPEDRLTDVDFIAPGGLIQGRVTRGDEANPISTSTVKVLSLQLTVAGSPPVLVSTQTGPDGTYVVDSLPTGTYLVQVDAQDYATVFQNVEISEGDPEVTIDFSLGGGGHITGKVLKEDGIPLSGASVSAFDENRTIRLSEPVFSDSTGRYVIEDLDPGTYLVVASIEGTLVATYQDVAVQSGRTTTGIDFILSSVAMGSISGSIRSSDETPIQGAIIVIGSETAGAVVYSDAGGHYIAKLPSGLYKIIVAAHGFNSQMLEEISVLEDETTDCVDFSLNPTR